MGGSSHTSSTVVVAAAVAAGRLTVVGRSAVDRPNDC